MRRQRHTECHEDESDETIYDGDQEHPIYDNKSHDDTDDEFYGNIGQSVTLVEVDWSKAPIFDDYSDDVRIDDMMIFDTNQDSDGIDHPIFDECEDTKIEKVPTFGVYHDDKSFDGHKSLSCYNDHESNTKSTEDYPDLSFKED